MNTRPIQVMISDPKIGMGFKKLAQEGRTYVRPSSYLPKDNIVGKSVHPYFRPDANIEDATRKTKVGEKIDYFAF